ncbi:hypothetical protein BC831DRAFT_412951 [Entophlyctis helioformis]|nr:hypothetical protein BC831DRAFT_412951 [Entophlyctis helioformis]
MSGLQKQTAHALHPEHLPPLFVPKIRAVVHATAADPPHGPIGSHRPHEYRQILLEHLQSQHHYASDPFQRIFEEQQAQLQQQQQQQQQQQALEQQRKRQPLTTVKPQASGKGKPAAPAAAPSTASQGLVFERLSQHYGTLLPKLRQVKPVSTEDVKAIARTITECGYYAMTERGLMPGFVGDVSRLLLTDESGHKLLQHVKPKMFTSEHRKALRAGFSSRHPGVYLPGLRLASMSPSVKDSSVFLDHTAHATHHQRPHEGQALAGSVIGSQPYLSISDAPRDGHRIPKEGDGMARGFAALPNYQDSIPRAPESVAGKSTTATITTTAATTTTTAAAIAARRYAKEAHLVAASDADAETETMLGADTETLLGSDRPLLAPLRHLPAAMRDDVAHILQFIRPPPTIQSDMDSMTIVSGGGTTMAGRRAAANGRHGPQHDNSSGSNSNAKQARSHGSDRSSIYAASEPESGQRDGACQPRVDEHDSYHRHRFYNYTYPVPLVPMHSLDLDGSALLDEAGASQLRGRHRVTDTGLPVLPGWVITIKLWQLQTETKAFEKFAQVTTELGIDIAALWIIERITSYMKEFSVPYAELKCARIIACAQRPCLYPLRHEDIMNCIENIEEVLELLLKPGQRYRAQGSEPLAAVTIQNAYRRYVKRKEHLAEMVRVRASRMIQKYWDRRKALKKLWQKVEERYQTTYKSGFRRLWSIVKRDRIQIFGYKRIIIQLCSWSVTHEGSEANMSDLDIGRALAMYDDHVDMIFVLPHLSEERLNYFKSVFETSAFPKSPIVSGRLRFVVPEIAKFLPKNSSVAAALFFSSKALSQIKAMCIEKTALICSDFMNEYVVRCCTALNIPYFGTLPEAYDTVTCDPARERKFLRDCCIPTIKEYEAKGKSQAEFVGTIFKAATMCKSVPVWSFWPRKPIVPLVTECSYMETAAAVICTSDIGVAPVKRRGPGRGNDFLASVANSRAGSAAPSRFGSTSNLFQSASSGPPSMGAGSRFGGGALPPSSLRMEMGNPRQPLSGALGQFGAPSSRLPGTDRSQSPTGPVSRLQPGLGSRLNPAQRPAMGGKTSGSSSSTKDSRDSALPVVPAQQAAVILSSIRMSDKLPDTSVDDLLAHWNGKGGVVRAYPNAEGNFRIIEVGISVEWSLQWRLIVSCETRMHNGKTFGIVVPQQSCDSETLIKYIYKVAKVCSAREIFGAVTVEFWAWKDPITSKTMIVATRLKPYFTVQLQRASAILISIGCKTDKTGYGMSYSRIDLPIKLQHLTTSIYGDRKKALKKFQNAIPPSPTRVALHFDNLRHGIVSILSRRGALAKLAKRNVGFDQWRCFGFIFTKSDSIGPDLLPVTCIANTLDEVYELFLGGLILIERHLEAKEFKCPNNFREKAKIIMQELKSVQRLNSLDEEDEEVAELGGGLSKLRSFGSNDRFGGFGSIPDTFRDSDEDMFDEAFADGEPVVEPIEEDLEEMLSPFIKLPFGEQFTKDMPAQVLNKSIRGAGDAGEEHVTPSISSTTTMLLLEGVPSLQAAEHDATFFKPVVTPPSQRRGRRRSSSVGSNGSGGGSGPAFASAAAIAEQQESQRRAAVLLQRLEKMMDKGVVPNSHGGAAGPHGRVSTTSGRGASHAHAGAQHGTATPGTAGSAGAAPVDADAAMQEALNKLKWHVLSREPENLKVETTPTRRPSALIALSPTTAFSFAAGPPRAESSSSSSAGSSGRNKSAASATLHVPSSPTAAPPAPSGPNSAARRGRQTTAKRPAGLDQDIPE